MAWDRNTELLQFDIIMVIIRSSNIDSDVMARSTKTSEIILINYWVEIDCFPWHKKNCDRLE